MDITARAAPKFLKCDEIRAFCVQFRCGSVEACPAEREKRSSIEIRPALATPASQIRDSDTRNASPDGLSLRRTQSTSRSSARAETYARLEATVIASAASRCARGNLGSTSTSFHPARPPHTRRQKMDSISASDRCSRSWSDECG